MDRELRDTTYTKDDVEKLANETSLLQRKLKLANDEIETKVCEILSNCNGNNLSFTDTHSENDFGCELNGEYYNIDSVFLKDGEIRLELYVEGWETFTPKELNVSITDILDAIIEELKREVEDE